MQSLKYYIRTIKGAFKMKSLLFLLSFFAISQSYMLPTPPSYDFWLQVARDQVPNTLYYNKFGENPDIDAADGFLTVWERKSRYPFPTVANVKLISSDNVQDTTQTIKIYGLDSNWDLSVQTATLNGQTPDTLDTPLIRVFRMENTGATALSGNAYIYPDTATISAGVPTLTSNIKAQITNGNNQTLMSVLSVPRNYTAYLYNYHFALSKATASTVSICRLRVAPFGEASKIKEVTAISSAGTSIDYHNYTAPVVIPEKSDIELTANASANNTGVAGSFYVVFVKN